MAMQVWGVNVCDDEAWFLNKVEEDIADWSQRYGQAIPPVSARVIDGYVGPGYGRAEAEVFDTIAELAREEGLVLDPVYTGKAFHGMLKEIEQGRFDDCKDIVFIHTGGIFGVFPQRQGFNFGD
jgi:D-cysteine desulfhydrase